MVTDLDTEPPFAPEPVLVQLQRLFREADRATRRAFCAWLQEYAQLQADQGFEEG